MRWTGARDMPGAQVAVSNYKPADWPEGTSMLIRRVALDAADISTDPRARRRRTIPKDQLQLALDGQVSTVYGYSFILTYLDVSTGTKAVSVEYWYRHRTEIEDRFRDSKHGAALRHLPSGHPVINTAWMWGALLPEPGRLAAPTHRHQRRPRPAGRLGDPRRQSLIATLRRRLIRVPARLVTHAGGLLLRPPPGYSLPPRSSPACAPYPP